jgi:hypothetical protein
MFDKPSSITPARSLEWSRPVIPPRSRLYSLEPLGVGTAGAESLFGYVARLAQAHCVGTGALLRWVAEFLPEGVSKRLPVDLNGFSEATNRWRLTIERLTGRTGLHCLTMLIWHNVVARGRTLKILFRMVPGVFANGFGALPPPPLGFAPRNGVPDSRVPTPGKMPEMLSQNPAAELGKSPWALSVV